MMRKEEFLRLLDGELVSRVPVCFWHHFFDKVTMTRIPKEPEMLEAFYEANRRWKADTDPDYVKVMTDGYRKPEIDIGSGSPADIAALKVLDLPGFVEGSEKLIRGVREIYGNDVAMFMTVFSPCNILFDAMKPIYGDDTHAKLAEFLQTNSAEMDQGLQRISEALCRVVDVVIGEGKADGIYFASRMFKLPAALFEGHVDTAELMVLDRAESLSRYNILHICHFDGKQPDIRVYKKYPGKVLHLAAEAEELPLTDVCDVLGDRVVLGGFGMKTSDVLFTGPKEAIEKETQRFLDMMKGKRFILGTDCSVSQKIDPQHCRWVVDYIRANS